MTLLTGADRTQETANDIGSTVGIVLLGAAAPGLQSFQVAGLDGEIVPYTIQHETSGQWEVGSGEYVAATHTLNRTTVYKSSDGGGRIDFDNGVVDVWVDAPAEKTVLFDADSDHLTLPAGLSIAGALDGVTTLLASGAATFQSTAHIEGATTLDSTLTVATSLNPATDNAAPLGISSKRWSDLRAVTATLSGLLTAAGGATVASGQTLTLAGATVAGAPTWSSNQAITLSTASQPNVTTMTGLVTVGALASGSIAVGFGNINNAGNSLTTGALVSTTAVHSGSVTPGADNLYALGTVGARWSDLRAMTATFSSGVTMSSTLAIGGITYTFPGSQSANAFLQTNGSGTLSWVTEVSGISLAGLSDVTITSATNGQALIYNSGTSKWNNSFASLLTSVGTLTGLTMGGTIGAQAITPNTDNTYALGTASFRWSDLRALLATFSGVVVHGGTASFTAASPFSVTNGQVLIVATTAQTVGAATLTLPNFASVSDTFAFITLAQTLSNKTLASPTLSGTVAGTPTIASGWTWSSNQPITLSTAAQPNVTSLGTLAANLLFVDATYDIGASGATRPRNLYVAGTMSFGPSPAGTGALRGPNNDSLYQRNAANSGDVQIIGLDSSNKVRIDLGGSGSIIGGAVAVTGAGSTSGIVFEPLAADSTYGLATWNGAAGVTTAMGFYGKNGASTFIGNVPTGVQWQFQVANSPILALAGLGATVTGTLGVSGIITQSSGASAITIGYNGGGPAPAIYGDSTGRIAYAADIHNFFNKNSGTLWWEINTSGHFVAGTDNTYDVGQSGANRPRHLYMAGNGTFGGNIVSVGGALQAGNASLAGAAEVVLDAAVGNYRFVSIFAGNNQRWNVGANNGAESGADAGSDFQIFAYTDAGSFIDVPLTIIRAAGGSVTIARPMGVGGAITSTVTNNAVLSATSAPTSNPLYINLSNTSGSMVVGVDNSAGAYTGGPAYAAFFGSLTSVPLTLVTGGNARWNVAAAGHFVANTDNVYDIGASGATRPRDVYVAGLFRVPLGGALAIASDITQLVTPNDNVQGARITSTGGFLLQAGASKTTVMTVNGATLKTTFSQVMQMSNYGAGAATFDASGNITSVSDERHKADIAPFTLGLSALRGIRPILHRYNELSGLETAHTYLGFSAQNVREHLPGAVFENAGGMLSLYDRGIMAATVNAVNELDARVSRLEARAA